MNIENIRLFLNVAYITIIFIFSLLYLLFAVVRISPKRSLLISLFGFSSLLRAVFHHMQVILYLFPDIPVPVQHASQLAGLFLGAGFFLWYIQSLYEDYLPKWSVAVVFAVSIPAFIFKFLEYEPWGRYAFVLWTAASALIFLFCIIKLIIAAVQKNPHVWFRLAAILNITLLGVYDSFVEMKIINTIMLLPIGVCLFFLYESIVNVIERIKAAERLEEMNVKMHKLDSVKNEFLANTSHELRTPLHGIIGLAESMLKGSLGPMNEEQKSTLGLIVSSGFRLASLVSDILDYSRIRENTLHLSLGPVHTHRIISNILRVIHPVTLGKDIEIKNNVGKDSPAVKADPARIEQIFYNLIGNAIKFTDSGTISIDAAESDGYLCISVSDTGRGINENKLHDIFKAYETGDLTLLEGYEGTGLGLSITKRLVELHKGTISIKSKVDEGTTITCWLPLWTGLMTERPQKDEDEGEELTIGEEALFSLQPVSETQGDTSGSTILVIDDSAENLQIMKNQLSSGGYRIIPALSGKEGLRILEEKTPELIILDVMMPGMDGYELCRKIREKHSQTELPIIMVTARSASVDMMEGLNAGANDFLTKPYSLEVFLTRVKTHLNLSAINRVYNQFVPVEFLQFLGRKEITDVHLGDQIQKDMTVLFVDIRAFTNLSENMTPSENFKFINSYLSRLSPFITKHGGIIDKYIGDSIMALFPDTPEAAVRSAIDMVNYMETYNGHRSKVGYKPIHVGVGVHTGNLILGIIGDKTRMQGTVISDAVNLASRIQNVTKLYGANIVISQDTFVQLDNPTDFNFRFLGKVKVKGKNQSVSLFEIFDADPEETISAKDETKTNFEEGILLFSKREFSDASKLFRKVLERNPDDHAAKLFLEKSENFITLEKKRFLFNV